MLTWGLLRMNFSLAIGSRSFVFRGEPSARIELATPSLPRKCTTTVLRGQIFHCELLGVLLHTPVHSNRAGEGTRTLDNQLGRLELYQLSYTRNTRVTLDLVSFSCRGWWTVVDSNHGRHKPADLQSAPFGRSGNRPYVLLCFLRGAGGGTRTRGRLITNQVLYQLSYASRPSTRGTDV